MNDDLSKCSVCGSARVIPGKLSSGEGDAYFEFSEFNWTSYWTTLSATGSGVPMSQHGSARVCIDCGAVSASLTVDVKELQKVLDKWGTEALKSRLASGHGSL
jgi:hypothetical protein